MSDFLSNFNEENYKKRAPREEKKPALKKESIEKKKPATSEAKKTNEPEKKASAVHPSKTSPKKETPAATQPAPKKSKPQAAPAQAPVNKTGATKPPVEDEKKIAAEKRSDGKKYEKKQRKLFSKKTKSSSAEKAEPKILEDGSEFDPTYKRKKQLRLIMIAVGIIVLLIGAGIGYYQMNYVKVPDFSGEALGDARSWLTEKGMELELVQEYDDTVETNLIIEQKPVSSGKIKKGSTIQLIASKGPDPDAVLAMPDFMAMTRAAAEEWKEQNQASNFSIIEEYSDTVEKDQPLRLEFNNKDTTRETYQRKETAKLYVSKGKEVFEKNIALPDFVNKPRSEVEAWAKTNEIAVTYEERADGTIEAGNIIEQSTPKDEKVAKRDALTVVVSVGKAIVVPNFADYTPEDAMSAAEGLNVQVKTIFSENVAYGQLISQSVEAGKELTANDNLNVQVSYSLGKPYIKDLRGSMVEGDLPKYFFDEYQSKGANITSQVRYVDSAETKGMVVGMSAFNQYLPMEYVVYFDISKGNLTGAQTYGAPGTPTEENF